MELELKKNIMQCYQQVLDTTLQLEETQEAIVPDACPDIGGIISVCGQICFGEKQVSQGQISVTGQVETTILYESEEGGDVQKMKVKIPFKTQITLELLGTGDEVFVIPTFSYGEARVLNPRKILVRVEILLEVSGFQANALMLCCGVEGAGSQGMEERMTSTEIRPLCTVQSKHFTFDENITLQGQGELEDILSIRIYPNCTESKLIGNKLIFKGDTEVQIMYLDEAGHMVHSRHALPFSQIMEVEDVGEGGHSAVSVVLTSFYANPSYEGARTVDLTLDCMAQATVRGAKHLDLLEDAYSTTHYVNVEKQQYTLVTVAEEYHVPQPFRQIFETSMPVQVVEDSWISVGKVTQEREQNQITFQCEAHIFLLCSEESGGRKTLEFTQTVSHKADCPEDVVCCCRCHWTGEVFATPAPGGVEVRFTPQFTYTMVEGTPVDMVVSAALGEVREKGKSSVVLRLPQQGETLWDIAKAYGTTTAQIMQANQLQEEYPPTGQMLLIPSLR